MKNLKPAGFLILVIVLFSACKRDPVDYSAYNAQHGTHIGDGDGGATSTAAYYFKGTIDGKAVNWTVTANESDGWNTGTGQNISGGTGDITGALSASIDATMGGNLSIGAEFRTMHYNDSDDKPAYLKSFITAGSWPFDTDNVFTVGTKTITIQYIDALGNEYSSDGVQTGSANVTSVTVVPGDSGLPESLKIKLTFSCTLYPADVTGSPIQLTNGEATLRMLDLL
jgi:hypothetical protein